MRNLAIWAIALMVMVASLMWMHPPAVVGQSEETVRVVKEIIPADPTLDSEVTIRLTLTGTNTPCDPQIITNAPLDIALVMDHSGSMESFIDRWLGSTKLDYAKQAAIALIDELNAAADRVAVVKFTWTAELVHPLSSRYEDVRRAISPMAKAIEVRQ